MWRRKIFFVCISDSTHSSANFLYRLQKTALMLIYDFTRIFSREFFLPMRKNRRVKNETFYAQYYIRAGIVGA